MTLEADGTVRRRATSDVVTVGVSADAVASAIDRVEGAWNDGDLAAALELPEIQSVLGEETQRSYAAWTDLSRPAFREVLVGALLDSLRARIRKPTSAFQVTAVEWAPSSGSASLASPNELVPRPRLVALRVSCGGADTVVRMDQALSARRWGMWFNVSDADTQDVLNETYERHVVTRFLTDLRVINRLPADFGTGRAILGTDDDGLSFEQLVLDILNEEAVVARRARLDQDLFDKTDLRVQYPGLERKKGARVQVTLITDPHLHDEKYRHIHQRDEYVFLSPLSVARAAWSRAGSSMLPVDLARQFFACFVGRQGSPEELALGLREVLLGAIRGAPTPLGPVLNVPEAIRMVIRRFVESEARATTAAVNNRKRRTGKKDLGRRGRWPSSRSPERP